MKLKNPSLLRNLCYIGGLWQKADSQEVFSVFNPSTGSLIGTVPKMGRQETQQAIIAASKALPLWKEKTAKERSAFLRNFHDLILAHKEDLATIITLEQGKPYQEALAEVDYGASFLNWFAEEAKRVYGDIIPSPVKTQRLLVLKEPVGVVGAITPWNFPIAMITRKCAPALAAGCSIVIKPAEATPLSALALAFLAHEAGIPAGVCNVITGDPILIGEELTSHPKVRKITFTGSTKTGKLLMEKSSSTLKKVSLELGGSAPFIVFEDTDIDSAIEGLMRSKFRNSGQSCICADRVFIEHSIYNIFIKKLQHAVELLSIGDGFKPGIQIGPLINEASLEKIERHIQDALSQGAYLVCGGKRHDLGGTFFQPTILKDVTPSMDIMKEETFGPILPITSFSSELEVLSIANDTKYGLASYIYTKDLDRVWRIAEKLEFGMVSINGGLFSNEVAPFGGIKESGIGREGSKYGIEEFLEKKYLCITESPSLH